MFSKLNSKKLGDTLLVRMSNGKPLSRGQKIQLLAIIATVAVASIGWFVKSRSHTNSQQPQIAVTGNGSSAVNGVTGDQNIIGNNNTVIQSPVAGFSQTPAKTAHPQKKTGTISGIQANQSPSTLQTANAPNGIAITGGTVTNPTVNNYGPPPVEIRFNARSIQSTDPQFEYEAEVTISVNASYSPVSLAFICESEIKKVTFDFGRFAAALLNERIGVSGDNKIGFVTFEGTAVTPERPLYVHIWASSPFRVTDVKQAKLNN
jgi:hypothetical protein